jgi:hypothetical protein
LNPVLIFWCNFVTVTRSFVCHVIGLLKGDPRRPEAVRKCVSKGIIET